jgi:hypothetical protein
MFAPAHDFFRALNNARRATRRGDHAGADRWTRIADRHLQMAQRLNALEAGPKPPPGKRERPAEYNPPDFIHPSLISTYANRTPPKT